MRTALFAVLLLLLTSASRAALPEHLSETLRPVDGVVIKLADGECLIDLGSQDGLRVGDLLAVLEPGEELRHPVSGALLGRIDRARTFLRVTRVKPDFSWARPLAADIVIRPADAVRRYGEVPALLIPANEEDHTLYNDLQTALPHLAWRPWREATLNGPGLIFSRTGSELIVRDDSGTRIGAWSLTAAKQEADIRSAGELLPIAHKFAGKARGLAAADLDGDGLSEIAVALENRVEIGRISGADWQALTQFELPLPHTILTLDAADLDGDNHSELLITAVRGERLASQLWNCTAQSCRAVASAIPWYFRVVNLPGQGPTPLAQKEGAGNSSDYFDRPFTFSWQEGRITAGEALALPPELALHGMQPISAGAATLWAHLDSSDRLSVTDQNGELLWSSREKFGGSETYIDKQPANKRRDESRRFYLSSRLAREGETLVVPQNNNSGSFASLRHAGSSCLVGLRWNGDALAELWRSPTRDGYLADFVHNDIDGDGRGEYLLLGSTRTGFFGGSRSTLYRWQQ